MENVLFSWKVYIATLNYSTLHTSITNIQYPFVYTQQPKVGSTFQNFEH